MLHPGQLARDELAERGWSVETLAERAGLPVAVIREFIEFDWPMTDRLAAGLSRAFGTSRALWKNLDAQFQRGWSREDRAA